VAAYKIELPNTPMGADQIAEIAPALREALAGGPDTCVTFEVMGAPEKWVQFVGGTLNAAYPGETPGDASRPGTPSASGSAGAGTPGS